MTAEPLVLTVLLTTMLSGQSLVQRGDDGGYFADKCISSLDTCSVPFAPPYNCYCKPSHYPLIFPLEAPLSQFDDKQAEIDSLKKQVEIHQETIKFLRSVNSWLEMENLDLRNKTSYRKKK